MRYQYGTINLTPKEQAIYELVAQGLTNKEIAERTGNTEHVVKNYMRTIYDKLGCSNRVELALRYFGTKNHTGGKSS